MNVSHRNAGKRRHVSKELERQVVRDAFMDHLRASRRYRNIVAQDLRPYRDDPDYFNLLAEAARALGLTVDGEPADWVIEYLDADVQERPEVWSDASFTGAQEAHLHLSVSPREATIELETVEGAERRTIADHDLTIPLDLYELERAATGLVQQWLAMIQPKLAEHGQRRDPSHLRKSKEDIVLLYDVLRAAANGESWSLGKATRARLRSGVARLLPLDLPRKS